MSKQTLGLEQFLEAYKAVLVSIRTLARTGVVAPAAVRDALIRRPFALPALLKDVPDAASVAGELRRLKDQRAEVSADPATIDARIEAAIRQVLKPRGAARGAMRGGDEQSFETAPQPQAVARELPPTMESGLTPPAPAPAERPRGQRAKPPDRGGPPEGPPLPASDDAAAAAPPEVAPAAQRWISAEIDDHERDEPLAVGETYTIAFGVDEQRRANAVGDAAFEEGAVFPDGVNEVELTVDLHGDDFDIAMLKQTFKLRRSGKSQGKAQFEITPKREGRATLTATIHKERNFVQEMTITLSVGAANAEPPSTTLVSRPRSAVAQVKSREVMIVMKPDVPNGYDVFARDLRGFKTAHLEVTPDELNGIITAARDALLGVVQHADANGEDVFQTRIDIAAPDNEAALGIMARAGASIFRALFKHDGGSQDATAIGQWLRDLQSDTGEPMSIQVMSKSAPIPWAMLYVGDTSPKAKLDWNNFLGFRHVIEQLPMVEPLGQGSPLIASDQPGLEVSINLNPEDRPRDAGDLGEGSGAVLDRREGGA